MKPFLICLAMAWLAAALPAQAAEILWSEAQNAITLEGAIAAGDEQKFAALLDHRPHELIVRSDGGAQFPALVIARELHARGMTVVVDGYCASACAQILFAAAAERRMRPNSFVALHGGNVPSLHALRDALLQALAQLPDTPDAASHRAALAQALRKSQIEVETVDSLQATFEDQMKLDREVGAFYKRLTAPARITVALKFGADGSLDYDMHGTPSQCDWWIPDQDGLARLGLTLRNSYERPPLAFLATATRSPANRLYLGPPVAPDDAAFATLCKPE